MLPIPENVLYKFNEILKQRAVVESLHVHYRKWLRYFLDFFRKYSPPEAKSEQVRLFIDKLKSKNQTPQQCTQAAHAISLFFESQKLKNYPQSESTPPARPENRQPRAHNTDSTVVASVRDPSGASAAITHLSDPHVITGGKRYNEWRCMEKTKSPAWDQAIEKGDKDRTVPLPQTLIPKLKIQLEAVSKLHDKDLAADYDGVFLDDALEKKYPAAAKEFIWQWIFPQKELTLMNS